MPIYPGSMPKAAVAVVEQAMRDRVIHSGFTTANLSRARIGSLYRSFPHRVEYLSLQQIRRGHDLRQAVRAAGWRFLIYEEERVIASARAVANNAGKYSFAEFTEGAFVIGTEQIVHFAERELTEVRDGRFEAVLLVAPEIHIIVLWLQNLETGGDYVLTIPTAAEATSKRPEVMTGAVFLAKVRALAEAARRPQRDF